MKLTAQGRLRHCFFGTYHARVVLAFDSPTDAENARVVLGASWRTSAKNPDCLYADLSSDQLNAFKDAHKPVADVCDHPSCCKPIGRGKNRRPAPPKRHEIDGCEHSVDVGPAFSVDVHIPLYVPAEQASLPFEVQP